ncbi:MAG: hypothetical protein AB1427_08020 [Thermodesulfobacteriota bacterium]
MKMKNPIKSVVVLFFCVTVIAMLAGCSQPPKQEVDAANAALQAAVAAGAEQYAAAELKAAQDLSAKLNGEMEKKDYKAAKQTAVEMKDAADKAKAAAEAEKAKAKEAATAGAAEVKQGLEKAKGLVAEAAKMKLPADLLKPIQEQLAAAEAGAGELDGMVAAEKFKEAADKGAQLKDQFAKIEQGITDAKAKAAAAAKKPAAVKPAAKPAAKKAAPKKK